MNNTSILVLGPSGTGKSSLIAAMLRHFGSGAIALAPGWDEKNSYVGLLEKKEFVFQGFEEKDFQPYFNVWETNALKDLITWLNKIRDEVMADVAESKEPRYKVLALDTVSAMARYGLNRAIAQLKVLQPPAAKSPDGAAYYSVVKQVQESMYRPIRAIYGAGVNVIAAAHVTENENISEAAVAEKGAKMILPDVPGGFKTVLPSFFDTVLHAQIFQGKHVLQWKPTLSRPTKSRMGDLGTALMENNFQKLYGKILEAAEKKANG